MDTLLTADVAENAPNFKRRSSTYVDAIHDLPEKESMAPAQLYSTESGRLFHSGRIVIATVGLPARGKTHTSVALARYLRWLGVKYEFSRSVFRAQVDSQGKVGCLLDKVIAPAVRVTFAGELDHAKVR